MYEVISFSAIKQEILISEMAFEQEKFEFLDEIWILCVSDDFGKFSIKIEFGQ